MSTATTSGSPPRGAAPQPGALPAEPPPHRWWTTRRFLLAAVGIVLLSGGATAVLALNEVGKLVEALGQSKAVKVAPQLLAPAGQGTPETLLLVGNDERPPPKGNPYGRVLPHSNEMLLVRIDPSKPTISMLSIPRELQVTIYPPGAPAVTTRINAAYTYGVADHTGGAQLMIETIKRVLGVSVNHVFVTNFPKFRRAVDEMGCVYMTVDRRYHHVNEPGGEQYFEINLQPGYQRLCGREALEFVANRHEDTSLIRDARDQRFLLEVKAQYGATLFESREKFERILGRTVETDLHGTEPVLNLLELLVQSQGKPVRQVPFQVNLLPTFDTANAQQIHESVHSFLSGTAAIPKRRLNGFVRAARSSSRSRAHHAAPSPTLGLTPTPASALAQARSIAPELAFPLEYPRGRVSYLGAGEDTLRRYDIRDQRGYLHPIYAIVVNNAPLGQFYDVQGTSWGDPPLLSDPSQTVRIGARTYGLFYEGEHIRAIAWREANAAYWIQNTLTNNVSPRAMLALAEQTVPVISTIGTPGAPALASGPRDFNLPPRTVTATSLTSKLGAVLGILGVGVVALLSLLALARRRELNSLREQVAQALALEARQHALLAAAGIPHSATTTGGILDGQRTPAVYRVSRRWRKGLLASASLLIVGALIAFGVHLLQTRTASPARPVRSSVAVAVFNATAAPGAAHRIAATLKAGRVRIGEVGDIKAGLGPGTYVLYPPGTQAEAQLVARLLGSPAPIVEPIQPQVQDAVSRHNQIVVVLD